MRRGEYGWRQFVRAHADIVGFTTDPDIEHRITGPVPPGAGLDNDLVQAAHVTGTPVFAVYDLQPAEGAP
ncbi:hypothetical protein [Amycolatopsis thermoflava]|uniref:hypothetical protein n=1 Tax=Amycolatopsis thermoflava TaxID=84480 RepID=UPI003815CDE3